MQTNEIELSRAVEAIQIPSGEMVSLPAGTKVMITQSLGVTYTVATEAGLARGHKIYQDFCLGCHGPVGDGMGPAQPHLYPPPLNFTILKNREISGGILYYQIMNGITGTAMPYFKRELESEKIWDVGNYVAVYFINQTDANTDPRGIDASYEP